MGRVVVIGVVAMAIAIVGFFTHDAAATTFTLSDSASCIALGGTWDSSIRECTVQGLSISSGDVLQINRGTFLLIDFGTTLDNSGTINIQVGGGLDTFSEGHIKNHVGASINNEGKIVYFEAEMTNDGIITNSGTISFGTLDGAFLYNDAGGVIQNSGTIKVDVNGLLSNAGIVNNPGAINMTRDANLENFGKINVQAGGSISNSLSCATITNHEDSTINNHGIIDNTSCDLNNYGKINNGGIIFSGKITNTDTINNNGGLGVGRQFDNYGKINNVLGASIGEDSGATITNHVGATINNSGNILNGESEFDNYGKINNSGMIEGGNLDIINEVSGVINNSVGAVITAEFEEFFANHGKINNRGTINVDSTSTFDNTGGTLRDICGGVFNNAGTFLGNAVIVSC